MKVYGVVLWVNKCPPAPNGSRQARCVVAAKSKAAAARVLDCTIGHLNTYGSTTGNEEEIRQAMTEPGVAFWTNDRYSKTREWHRFVPVDRTTKP